MCTYSKKGCIAALRISNLGVDLFSDHIGQLSDTNIVKSVGKELIKGLVIHLRTAAGADLNLLPTTSLDDIMP